MDPRFVEHYQKELQHLKEMGAEFALAFPKIAARLGVEGLEVTDPYVERLLEGSAFLAARVQVKLEAEFPRFTQRLLEMLYPNYLAPLPAMLIARFDPDPSEPGLATGDKKVPRMTSLKGLLGRGDTTACEFRTSHEVTLWPIEIVSAEYFSRLAPDLPLTALPYARSIRAGVRIRLKATAGLKFDQIALSTLRFFLTGSDEVAHRLYELCLGAPLGVVIGPGAKPWSWHERLPAHSIREVGFSDAEALLPAGQRSFQGNRLLQEYFAFPQRFLFVDIESVDRAAKRANTDEIELAILFEREDPRLENAVSAAHFALHCTPAINLFEKRAERVQVTEVISISDHANRSGDDVVIVPDALSAHQVVPDRARPMDFEVYEVTSVVGYKAGNEREQEFRAFYGAFAESDPDAAAYYMIHRESRVLSDGQQRANVRKDSVGTETFVSLVDPKEAPYSNELRTLAITTLCTNRDRVRQMPLGIGATDFSMEIAAPVVSIRAIGERSRPFWPSVDGGLAWRLISQLALNYVSLVDSSAEEGAAAIREILELHAGNLDPSRHRQIAGVQAVKVTRVVRRLPENGPITFGRGVRIELGLDDQAFQGASAYLLGSVLEHYFARYVSINSFTETVLRTPARGEIKRWGARWGVRPTM